MLAVWRMARSWRSETRVRAAPTSSGRGAGSPMAVTGLFHRAKASSSSRGSSRTSRSPVLVRAHRTSIRMVRWSSRRVAGAASSHCSGRPSTTATMLRPFGSPNAAARRVSWSR